MFTKRRLTTVLLAVMFTAGLALLAYPTFSSWWNSLHQSRAIVGYTEKVAHIEQNEYDRILEEAGRYNEEISRTGIRWELTDREKEEYERELDLNGTGVMAYIEIPSIGVLLPVCHGTDESILQTSVGHLEGTSLPVGGPGSHCVLSGHRGLPSARLFTDLDRLGTGDLFMLNVLDEVLTYEVDRIRIVLPGDLSEITIREGEDYCTLVTCTPYGVNTHRLLVRGRRIETKRAQKVRVAADAVLVDRALVALVFGVPMLALILFIWLTVTGVQRRNKRRNRVPTW